MVTKKLMLPPVFKTVKQPVGSKVCAACVAAMACGLSLEEAESRMCCTPLSDGTHYYRTAEMLGLLGKSGILTGAWFTVGRVPAGVDGFNLQCDIPIKGHPCVMSVTSRTYENAEHMVFFDGEYVRDPSPDVENTSLLTDYHVLEIYPLFYIDDTKELTSEILLKRYDTPGVSNDYT